MAHESSKTIGTVCRAKDECERMLHRHHTRVYRGRKATGKKAETLSETEKLARKQASWRLSKRKRRAEKAGRSTDLSQDPDCTVTCQRKRRRICAISRELRVSEEEVTRVLKAGEATRCDLKAAKVLVTLKAGVPPVDTVKAGARPVEETHADAAVQESEADQVTAEMGETEVMNADQESKAVQESEADQETEEMGETEAVEWTESVERTESVQEMSDRRNGERDHRKEPRRSARTRVEETANEEMDHRKEPRRSARVAKTVTRMKRRASPEKKKKATGKQAARSKQRRASTKLKAQKKKDGKAKSGIHIVFNRDLKFSKVRRTSRFIGNVVVGSNFNFCCRQWRVRMIRRLAK